MVIVEVFNASDKIEYQRKKSKNNIIILVLYRRKKNVKNPKIKGITRFWKFHTTDRTVLFS